jgi:hypothetical protein
MGEALVDGLDAVAVRRQHWMDVRCAETIFTTWLGEALRSVANNCNGSTQLEQTGLRLPKSCLKSSARQRVIGFC